MGDLFGRFLECQQDARLVKFRRATNQKLDAEHGLAAARTATEDRRPALRKSARGDIVKPANAGGCFLDRRHAAQVRVGECAVGFRSHRKYLR